MYFIFKQKIFKIVFKNNKFILRIIKVLLLKNPSQVHFHNIITLFPHKAKELIWELIFYVIYFLVFNI